MEHPGELIHSDLCGPMENTSVGGAKYFVFLKDRYSHYRKVYFIKHKSEVKEKLVDFIRNVKMETRYDIRTIRTDNGTEYVNKDVSEILKRNNIRHQLSVAYTPEQNGCAEREMRTIVEAARTMFHAKNLDMKLWAEAVNTATYVLNRTDKSTIKHKTPFELWWKVKTKNDHLRIFGSEAFVHIPK